MPKNLGDHEEGSIFGLDEPTAPEAAGEEPVVEELPKRRGRQEHGSASDSLSVVVTHEDDDSARTSPSDASKAPPSASRTTHSTKPGAKGSTGTKSGDGGHA